MMSLNGTILRQGIFYEDQGFWRMDIQGRMVETKAEDDRENSCRPKGWLKRGNCCAGWLGRMRLATTRATRHTISRRLSQQNVFQLETSCSNVIAEHLQLRFKHHNAAEDAVVCGLAALAMARDLKVATIAAIPARIGMREGRLLKRGYEPCSIARR